MRMSEVAERAGVSAATVSRVLADSPAVRPEYRERVFRTVEQLGYRPNRLASNLRRLRAEMIGVVVSDVENPHFTQMVRKVEDAAYRKGLRGLLCNTDEDGDKQRSYLEVLAAERVSGVILSTTDPAGPEIADLCGSGVPLVAFDRTVDDARADAVISGNVAGARLATEHLLGAGHKHVGFVGGPTNTEMGADRLRGYRKAMREASVEPRWTDGRYRIDGGERATEELLRDDCPTALVVANNLMTIGVLRALRRRRLRVPRDVALVAIDDPFWAELMDPPLTTLAQPVRRMADSAVEFLFERISNCRTKARKVVFDFDLWVRGSCGTAGVNKEGGT
jgi:LacI family transcriptional regulator